MDKLTPWINPFRPYDPYMPIFDYIGIDPVTLEDIYPFKRRIRFSRKKIKRNRF